MGNSFTKFNLLKQRLILLAGILLLNILSANAQLTDFIFNIEASNETCNGNGSLSFTTSGLTNGSDMLYTVYLLPNETSPVSSSPSLTVDGLSAGTYKVIALQTLGMLSNFVEQQVVIDYVHTPLTYSIETVTQNCNSGGEVVINTLTGTAVQYEIISPVTVPLQDSNVFTGLPEGLYNFRVIDDCGEAVVTTFTVDYATEAPVVSQPVYEEVLSGDCASGLITITNTISYAGATTISYPLTIDYVIHPADGSADIVSTQIFESGAPDMLEISNDFTFVTGQPYTYDIVITNGCGVQYGNNGMVVNPTPELSVMAAPMPCGNYYLALSVTHFSAPYTVTFDAAPGGDDFDPFQYNDTPGQSFDDASVFYGGGGVAMPEGDYVITITDACGRTATDEISIVNELLPPVVTARNNGCFSDMGLFSITLPDRPIATATITEAPNAYTQQTGNALPKNVSEFLNPEGKLGLFNMPVGDYVVRITDECGQIYDVEVTVPPFEEKGFEAEPQPDCALGLGGVKAISKNGKLQTMKVILAPAAFGQTLPYDVTDKIDASGRLYLTGLPSGNYKLMGIDVCGIEKEVDFTLIGNAPPMGSTFEFEPHCNSFDVALSDSASQPLATPTYWLQVENEDNPGEWMHPATNTVYAEGTMPDETNAVQLQNNQNNVNFTFFGNFRIVKAFTTVGDGIAEKVCFEVLGEFTYHDGAVIDNIYNLSCMGAPDDIYIEASGLAPLQYRIKELNGNPFIVENGENNIFTGLTPGTYTFEVEDACGHKKPKTVNISLLPDLTIANEATDIFECIEPGQAQQQQLDLSAKNAEILGEQSPDVYTVTYYADVVDAENGTNPLPYNYVNQSNPQTIYARVEHNYISVCHSVTEFTVQFSETPNVVPEEQVTLCTNEGSVELAATNGFDSYIWSTGETSSSITVTEPGTYTVTISKLYGDIMCEAVTSIVVEPSDAPEILDVDIVDWTENDNLITINAGGNSNLIYSIDGANYQESPTFEGLEPGIYNIFVRDVSGCGIATKEVALLNYPKFFTPNGDGHNDNWRIENSWLEKGMLLYIYDRYGKLITSFDSQSTGWDGTLHGKKLPSTDYWFVANRKDGRVFRGHFSMIR